MRIEYAVADLDKVLAFWSKEYTDVEGKRIAHHGTPMVDTHRRRVIFPLYVEDGQKVNLTVKKKPKKG